MKILITGSQGSGKTTQAKLLSEKLNLCLVKTGDILRSRAELGDAFAKELKEILDSGDLVDNNLVAEIVQQELSQPKCATGFVVDGYPRSIPQLELFDPRYDKVIYLEVTRPTVLKRLLARGRSDDNAAAIEERLSIYETETEEVLEHYRALGILITVNGEQEIEEVSKEIIEKLK